MWTGVRTEIEQFNWSLTAVLLVNFYYEIYTVGTHCIYNYYTHNIWYKSEDVNIDGVGLRQKFHSAKFSRRKNNHKDSIIT